MPTLKTITREGRRFYVHPETGKKVIGVTSVLDCLPKPFLQYWAAKVVAEYAVENLGSIVGLAMNDRAGTIQHLKGAPRRSTSGSAEIGTKAHEVFELLAKGEKLPRLHPDIKPFADHYKRFLDVYQPRFIMLEETVWNDELGVAGTFDALAEIEGQVVMIDNKTTKSGWHPEVALQLTAYAKSPYVLRPDGTTVPMPRVDGGAVMHVRPEAWNLVPVEISDRVFRIFKHLLGVLEWEREIKETVFGDPLPTVKKK